MVLLIGADRTAIAEFDSCGGSEAARLAAAAGDMRDCCCCGCQGPPVGTWDTSASPGSREDIGMVLPEACMDGEVSQAGGGGLLGAILEKGDCVAGGIALTADGEEVDKPGSSAVCPDCWEYRPRPDDPGMLNCRGRLPEGSEPYADRGELARSMGVGNRR